MTKVFISIWDNIHFNIQAADSFVKKDHKRASYRASPYYRYERVLLDQLHVRHMDHGEKKFAPIALLFKR